MKWRKTVTQHSLLIKYSPACIWRYGKYYEPETQKLSREIKKKPERNETRAEGTQERNRRKSHSPTSKEEQITRCPQG